MIIGSVPKDWLEVKKVGKISANFTLFVTELIFRGATSAVPADKSRGGFRKIGRTANFDRGVQRL
jgi:hypothetical protein